MKKLRIEKLSIGSFGSIIERELSLSDGLNIISGRNESGKSTVCAFISFIFYGFTQKADKSRYLSWETAQASGSITLSFDGGRYRIDRSVASKGRESVCIVDLETNLESFKDKEPWEVFIGVPEDVFMRTVFVRQSDGAKIDGSKIGDAIENIMFSADEAVDTQKALKRIDEARVSILYKNKKGGRLFDLQIELDALLHRFELAKETHAAIISDEGSLSDARKNLDLNAQKQKELSDKIEAVETAQIAKDFDRAAKAREGLELLAEREAERAERYSEGEFIPDADYIASVDSLSSELELVDKTVCELGVGEDDNGENGALSDNLSDKIKAMGGRAEVLSAYRSKKSRRSVLMICTVLLLIGFAAALVAGIIISSPVLCAVSAALAVVAAILLIVGMRKGAFEGGILSSFGVTDITGLELLLDKASAEEERRAVREESRNAINRRIAQLIEKRTQCNAQLSELLARWNKSSVSEAKSAYNEMIREIADAASERERLEGLLSVLGERLSHYDEAQIREKLSSLPYAELDADITHLKKELDFVSKAGVVLLQKIHNLEKELISLNASAEHPTKIYSAITEIRFEMAELEGRHDAYVLAYNMIEEASGSLRESLAPLLSERAGRYMGEMTGGRYDTIGVDRSLSMEYSAPLGGVYKNRSVDAMSAGTQDLAYISLRLALMEPVFRDCEVPIVFDESFTRLDDKRLEAVLSLLDNVSCDGRQILVFTSHSRESSICASLGANTVSLDGE